MVIKEIDLQKCFYIIKDCKIFIIKSTMFSTIIMLIYVFIATSIYTVPVIINPPKLTDAGNNITTLVNGMNLAYSSFASLEKNDGDITIGLLNTNSLMDMIIHKFHLVKHYRENNIELARSTLRNNVQFENDFKTGFVKIIIKDNDKSLATDIANFYPVALGQLISDVAYKATSQKNNFFSVQLYEAKKSLDEASNEIKNFELKHGIIASSMDSMYVGIITQLQAQLAVLEAEEQSMRLYATNINPDYQKLQSQIKGIKTQLLSLNKGNDNTDNFSIPSKLAPELARVYADLMRDFIFREEIYKIILRQFEASRLEKINEMIPTTIQVIDNAQVPIYRSYPKRTFMVSITFLFSVILSSFYCLYKKRNILFNN